VEITGSPHEVAVSRDGRHVAVSSRDERKVLVLDAATLELEEEISAGADPLGVTFSPDGDRVFVANGGTDTLLMAGLGGSPRAGWLATGNEPYALSLSRDGRLLAVANRMTRLGPPQALLASEVTLIDAKSGRIRERRDLVSAHLSEGVAVSSDGTFALATIIRFRNLLPITQVARGAVMNSALAFIESRPGGRTVQFPLDEVNAFYADPSGVVLTPDDRIAFVAHGGAQIVTAVDVQALRRIVADEDDASVEAIADDLGASSRYVLARIPTAANPRALAISPDGGRVYVAERLADSVAVIDTETLELIDRIDLGGSREITLERRGEQVFHDASITFQGQFSCRSCHPDGHTDGLIWDFDIDGIGKNLVETRSLRGIRDTAPYKWNGKNPDLPTQCGPRFALVLTRSDPFTPEQLEALVAFIESIPLPPESPSEGLEEAIERGREIFFRTATNEGEAVPVADRCDTCHRPPLFTDRLMTEVGTGGRFDTPQLLDIASSPPYLHDGRALTLEEIWTVHSPEDTHGITNDLTKAQLNDLIVYLRSL
jgi:YVTN family beta-propeller protein